MRIVLIHTTRNDYLSNIEVTLQKCKIVKNGEQPILLSVALTSVFGSPGLFIEEESAIAFARAIVEEMSLDVQLNSGCGCATCKVLRGE